MRMTTWLVATLLLVSSPLLASDRKTEELAIVGAAAADLITTEIALGAGGTELNPLMQSPGKRMLVKTAGTVAIIALARSLENEHPKAASVLRWSTFAVWVGAAGWNASVAIRF